MGVWTLPNVIEHSCPTHALHPHTLYDLGAHSYCHIFPAVLDVRLPLQGFWMQNVSILVDYGHRITWLVPAHVPFHLPKISHASCGRIGHHLLGKVDDILIRSAVLLVLERWHLLRFSVANPYLFPYFSS